MNRYVKIIIISLLLIPTLSHAAQKMGKFTAKNEGKSIALVSLSANNYSNSLQGWNKANTSDLMSSQLNEMVAITEELFSEGWTVIKTDSFVNKPEFQALAGEQRDVGLPTVNGQSMPLLSKNRKQMVKASIDKDIAASLAEVTGADYFLIIYSEWAVATGKFVPTSKSLAKNVVSIFNAEGKQVYKGRRDSMGNKTIGSFNKVAVNEETIGQWVIAFETGITKLYTAGQKKK